MKNGYTNEQTGKSALALLECPQSRHCLRLMWRTTPSIIKKHDCAVCGYTESI